MRGASADPVSHTSGVTESSSGQLPNIRLGEGQIALEPAQPIEEAPEQVRSSYRFSDPALSELPLEQLLDELLVRVQEALDVDTVALLLYDAEANQLVARAPFLLARTHCVPRRCAAGGALRLRNTRPAPWAS